MSLLDLRRRIDSGELSASDAIRQSLQAIGERDGALKAFASVDRSAVAGHGLLAGVALGVKDIIDTADLPTEMGCKAIYGSWRPRADAAIVSLAKMAGATVVGKTETTAFAFLDPAPTLNPHRADRTPGGSSSGSAAAVAAGLVPLAIGTQTGGSVIRPASFCGVAAIKPSFRLLPTVGLKTSAWTLDTLGLMAASVADCAYALEAISGREMRLPDDPGAPRFALARQRFAGDAAPEGEAALEKAARLAEKAGATVVEIDLPRPFADAWAIHGTVQNYEIRVSMAWEYLNRRADLPPRIGGLLDEAQSIRASDYDAVRGAARRARLAAKDFFAEHGVDAILTYSAPGAAPDRSTTGDPRFNKLLTLLGAPCVNVPGLVSGDSLPVGVQVVAPFGRDAQALRAAAWLERIVRA
nr:amidase [Alsobacter ponti]